MKGKSEATKTVWTAIVLIFAFSFSLSFFINSGCGDDDDDDDNNDDSNSPNICSSILEPEGLNLDEFEVSGLEDCASAGIDIEMLTFHYSEGRTAFVGTGVCSSEAGPHYIYSLDENGNSCLIELDQGEFQFAMTVTWCLNTLTVFVHNVPPAGSSLENAVCAIRLTATAEGLEECEGSPE
jgi:hypothetical protein